jgi:transcriptional regulator with XRE-family HTH domain
MRGLSAQQKGMIIKLFLEGCSYEEISSKLGIAKGSIANIIEGIRTGSLPLPADIAGYVDSLRRIAVDMRKNNTNVSELIPCLMIYTKLKSMGISNHQIDSWIDICRQIASEDVPNRQFVEAALELARLTSKTGMSYESLIGDYAKKSEELKSIQVEIAKHKKQADELRRDLTKQRKYNIQCIQSLKKGLAAATENHNKSKERMQAHLNKHLTENKLSWEKIDTVIAILDKKLSQARLTQAQVKELSKKIAAAGSLSVTISQQDGQTKQLSSELEDLSKEKDRTGKALQGINEEYAKAKYALISEKQKLQEVKSDYNRANAELLKIAEIVPQIDCSITLAKLLLGFLTDPQKLSDYDLDRFVNLMISIRQVRLGRGPNRVTDGQGKVICQCEVPIIYFDLDRDKYKADPDGARQFLADLIFPLVKDRFVPKSVYETLQQMKNVEMMMDMLKQRAQ